MPGAVPYVHSPVAVAPASYQHSTIGVTYQHPMLVCSFADQPQAASQAMAPPQAAAAGSSSKDPGSGFTDVVMPPESIGGAATASHQAGDEGNQGAVPGNARQDAAEPEATLPGGTATAGAHTKPGNSHTANVDASQKQLDWSAAAGKKRKANGAAQAKSCAGSQPQQLTKSLPKRQRKLKLSSSRT